MSKNIVFRPSWKSIGKLGIYAGSDTLPELIEHEPMLFGADPEYADFYGGPLTKAFIRKVFERERKNFPQDKFITIDSRTHLLQRGHYPCIPGWHLDLIPRDEGGKPNLKEAGSSDIHYLSVVGDCSLTEFLDDPIELKSPRTEEIFYGSINQQISSAIRKNLVNPVPIESHSVVEFGPRDLHRGTAATKPGWRFFIRLSFTSHREPTPKLRRQTQVYIPTPNIGMGW